MSVPSDAELIDVIARAAQNDVVLISRHPYEYATSAALEELLVTIGGAEHALILKHLDRDRMHDGARRSKPEWLYEPRREIAAYQLVAGAALGPRLYGVNDSGKSGSWLVLEKVAGVELWQVGEFSVWEAAAAWLAGFHRRFSNGVDDVIAAHPLLIDFDSAWFESWAVRAAAAVARSDHERAGELTAAIDRYRAVANPLDRLPRTFVHGEFYPSNVLVSIADGGAVDVRPVDWEMAGIGPAVLDLAALTAGWGPTERERLVAAYLGADPPLQPDVRTALDLARFHLALQWLGWAPDWRAPAEHDHDWVNEALDAVPSLGLR